MAFSFSVGASSRPKTRTRKPKVDNKEKNLYGLAKKDETSSVNNILSVSTLSFLLSSSSLPCLIRHQEYRGRRHTRSPESLRHAQVSGRRPRCRGKSLYESTNKPFPFFNLTCRAMLAQYSMDSVPERCRPGDPPGGALFLTCWSLWKKYDTMLTERSSVKSNIQKIKTWAETLVRKEGIKGRDRRKRLFKAVTGNRNEKEWKRFYEFMFVFLPSLPSFCSFPFAI